MYFLFSVGGVTWIYKCNYLFQSICTFHFSIFPQYSNKQEKCLIDMMLVKLKALNTNENCAFSKFDGNTSVQTLTVGAVF